MLSLGASGSSTAAAMVVLVASSGDSVSTTVACSVDSAGFSTVAGIVSGYGIDVVLDVLEQRLHRLVGLDRVNEGVDFVDTNSNTLPVQSWLDAGKIFFRLREFGALKLVRYVVLWPVGELSEIDSVVTQKIVTLFVVLFKDGVESQLTVVFVLLNLSSELIGVLNLLD
ncbi:hypothetical protein WICPIJ_006820 [Wickerhamomyces pijperi]|uniref:Uncharacterized protein n=1 Tax=Wickerhamomyces pijperi TaxID=599730 RepID=A0A9P8Q3P8_WICPI|nr:hypothetical protein WICPIJ_006820 [Wickerhamomyces pijperi]